MINKPNLKQKVAEMVVKHQKVFDNIPRSELIKKSIKYREAITLESGALATWTPSESTGRSPKDTYIVKHKESQKNIDWNSPTNIPLAAKTFDRLFLDALGVLSRKKRVYITDRVLGATHEYALPTKVITDRALIALFADNMFRSIPRDIKNSAFYKDEFTLLVLPYDKIETSKYEGKLRKIGDKTSNMAIAMDMDRRLGLVYGSAYCGSVKKLLFTVMNYLLPEKGILPLHCSASEGKGGDVALFLGLSGTGKTTLSTDPKRALIGNDEHGWTHEGIINFENGCYAKLINLNPKKEPEIFKAVFDKKNHLEHGCIIENVMVYPNGTYDLNDGRLTPNSRVSYPLKFLSNVKDSGMGNHPKTLIFLTADANGVLPPVAKLTPPQAMFWFLMGYTSKLAGTETGIIEPISVFSRFFGEPFMPRNPGDYTSMLGNKIKEHATSVYLINTGWSDGPYGEGSRIDIDITRKIVEATLNGSLKNVDYQEDKRFHFLIPKSCPRIDSHILNPQNTWKNKEEYEKRADKLAQDFANYFEKAYAQSNIDEAIKKQCPRRIK